MFVCSALECRFRSLVKPQIRFHLRTFRHDTRFNKAPKRDEKLPCQGHDPDLPYPLVPGTKASLVPLREFTLGLKAEPTPREFDRAASDVTASVLPDPLFPVPLAAVLRRRREPCERSYSWSPPSRQSDQAEGEKEGGVGFG